MKINDTNTCCQDQAKKPGRQKGMRGFSMVEVLVALLVLAIGLLGLAGLQASGMRFSGNSALRTQALILTQDIIERMRGNPDAVLNSSTGYGQASQPLSTFPTDCASTGCSSPNLATYDLVVWALTIQAQLPNGSATVAITPNSPSAGVHTAVITINWNERDAADGSNTAKSMATTVRL